MGHVTRMERQPVVTPGLRAAVRARLRGGAAGALLLLASSCSPDSESSPTASIPTPEPPAADLRSLTAPEQALVVALVSGEPVPPPNIAPNEPGSSVRGELVEPRAEPAQVTLARIRAAAADGIDPEDAAWLAQLVRDARPASASGRLVAANAIAALADDPGSPAREALRSLLGLGGAEPAAGELCRSLIVELLVTQSDDAAREILQAARDDSSALVRAKAERSLASLDAAERGQP